MSPAVRSGMSPAVRSGMSPAVRSGMSPAVRSGMSPAVRSGMSPAVRSGCRRLCALGCRPAVALWDWWTVAVTGRCVWQSSGVVLMPVKPGALPYGSDGGDASLRWIPALPRRAAVPYLPRHSQHVDADSWMENDAVSVEDPCEAPSGRSPCPLTISWPPE
ncbi:unnamed protein product [Ranitomeya imitator]|uniref:Uncharacterized protein n=1 Tax=Ranitomeya imitator TaxID=111125 RepID=A0ABN9LRI8_9NEOB|nr:unnamed protein product [Ranitomeya imitator]